MESQTKGDSTVERAIFCAKKGRKDVCLRWVGGPGKSTKEDQGVANKTGAFFFCSLIRQGEKDGPSDFLALSQETMGYVVFLTEARSI